MSYWYSPYPQIIYNAVIWQRISNVLSLNQLPDLFIDMHGWLWRIKSNFDPNGIPIEFSRSNFGDMLATVDFFVSLGMLIIIISLEREFWSTFNASETPTMKKCEVFEGSWKCKEFVKHMRIFHWSWSLLMTQGCHRG